MFTFLRVSLVHIVDMLGLIEESQENTERDATKHLEAGPVLASAGADWKHFCGAPLSSVCRSF